MNKKWVVIVAITILFLVGCQSSNTDSEKSDLEEIIPGTWEAVSLNVKVNTAEGKDTSYVFDVTENEWMRKIGQSIKTAYQLEQNNFHRTYYDRDGNKVYEDRGKWYVFGDSLMMVTPEATYNYIVSINGVKATFFSMVDWDIDGSEDDEYTGVQRKVSSYTE